MRQDTPRFSAGPGGLKTHAYRYDAAGHLSGDGNHTYITSDRGRLSSAIIAGSTSTPSNTVNYRYNALEQRTSKSGPPTLVPTGASFYVYDEQGQLLGEYDASGTALYETVHQGTTPVAVLQTAVTGTAPSQRFATTAYFVYADQLDTPRVITRASDQALVWRWDSAEPFALTLPNPNPSGLGAFTFNPRFPGQVYDAETGLHQNGYRDYQPQTGRYVQSDPIGLQGGINTYAYVGGNPASYTDPLGLNPSVGCLAGARFGPLGCGVGAGIGTAIMDGVALAAILSTPADPTKPEQCTDKPCPPCKTMSGKIVPVGTIGYRPLDTPTRPQHGIVGPHYNIYKANQYPAQKCDCFWQPDGAVPPSGLPAGAIPIEPFTN